MAVLKRENNLQLNNVTKSEVKVSSNPFGGSTSEAGLMTVVNSKKNGKRVTFNQDVWDVIGRAPKVDVLYTEDYVILMAGDRFPLRNITQDEIDGKSDKRAKPIIYNGNLVRELTQKYSLPFIDGKVSVTFTVGAVTEYDGKPCVAIYVRV